MRLYLLVSLDYGFFGKPGEIPEKVTGSTRLPILVVKDRKTKAIFSHPVPCKGVSHPYPARASLKDLENLGYKRAIVKSDQESSIKGVAPGGEERLERGDGARGCSERRKSEQR